MDDLNAILELTEKAMDSAIKALMENKSYFYQVGLLAALVHCVRLLSALAEFHLSSRYQITNSLSTYPIRRSTKNGTRITTPCAPVSSPPCLTPSRLSLVCSPTAALCRRFTAKALVGFQRRRLVCSRKRYGRTPMRFLLRREG